MGFYSGLNVLVTGGTGLIGTPLVEMLVADGAEVTVVSLDDPSRAPEGVTFIQADLREFSSCLEACTGKDVVFHLAGVKGSPFMAATHPADFFVPMLSFNTNIMEAAHRCGVERMLYTSSVGVYAPAEVFREDDVWQTFPSANDRFAGWAKRMGELQAEAYRIQYGWDKVSIVRPTNVYGPGDNFDPDNGMVIPSLIARAVDGEDPLIVWGDGSPVRDFVYSSDVAIGMMLAVAKGVTQPINLGSGTGVSIRQLVNTILSHLPGAPRKVVWDTTKPSGDARRIADIRRAEALTGFRPQTSLSEGIRKTVNWYLAHHNTRGDRYNIFQSPPLSPRRA